MPVAATDPSPWNEPTAVPSGAAGVTLPALAVNRAGHVHVVYQQGGDLWHAQRQPGGDWLAPAWVTGGTRPALAALGGSLHLAMVNEFAGNAELYYLRQDDGGLWSLPRNVSHTTGRAAYPRLALAADGAPHLVWSDDTPGYAVVYHAHKVGNYWVNRPIPSGRGVWPNLVVDGSGLAHVVWQDRQDAAAPWQVYYARGDGHHWTLPQNLSSAPDHDAQLACVALDRNDTVHVLWCERTANGSALRLSFRYGDHWTQVETLAERPGDIAGLCGAFSAQGTLHLAWVEAGRVCHRYRAPGGILGQVEVAAEGQSDAAGLGLALRPEEWDVHAVWVAGSAQERRLHYGRREPALPHRRVIPMEERE